MQKPFVYGSSSAGVQAYAVFYPYTHLQVHTFFVLFSPTLNYTDTVASDILTYINIDACKYVHTHTFTQENNYTKNSVLIDR